MQLILLGPPGSGKGTLAVDLIRIYRIPHISTGDIFREQIRSKTELGRQADACIRSGALVPDGLTIAMVAGRLAEPDCGPGFLLDGFPRTIAQAVALDAMPAIVSRPLTAVINVRVSDKTILERLSGRRICPVCGRSYNIVSIQPLQEGVCDACGGKLVQRTDDLPATILRRLKTYADQTEPLIGYYRERGLLFDVDNEGAVGSSLDAVRRKIDEFAAKWQA